MYRKIAFLLITILILSANVGAVTVTVSSDPDATSGWINEDSIASVYVDEAPCTVDYSCKLRVYDPDAEVPGVCPSGIEDFDTYDSEDNATINSQKWICAAAKETTRDVNSFSAGVVEFKVDKTNPTAVIGYPADASAINSITEISGTAQDTGGSGLEKVQIAIQRGSDSLFWNGNETNWETDITYNDATGADEWTYEFTLPDDISNNGTYTVIAKAIDNVDNNDSVTATFDFDTNKPQLLSGKYVDSDKIQLVFTERIDGENATLDVNFGKAGMSWTGDSQEVGEVEGGWAINFEVADGNAQESTWITITGTPNLVDEAGNEMDDTEEVTIIGENEAPVTTSSFTSTAWKKDNISISLSCSDVNWAGCKETFYCIDNESNDCNPWNGTEYTTTITHGAEGTSYIRFASKDNFGNEEKVKSQILKLDKSISAPSISISVSNDDVAISWDAVDENSLSGISCYEIRRSASNEFDYDGSGVTTVESCSRQGTGRSYTKLNLGNGTYYYKVKAVDNAGNEAVSAQASATVDVADNDTDDDDNEPDSTPPYLEWEAPEEDDVVKGTITLKVWYYDDESTLHPVSFYIDSNVTPLGTDGSGDEKRYSIQWDTTTVPDGEHKLKAVGKNRSGVSGKDNKTVTLDIVVNNSGADLPPTGDAADALEAINGADDEKENAASKIEELQAIEAEASQSAMLLLSEGNDLLEEAQSLYDDANYASAKAKAGQAKEKFLEVIAMLSVSDYGSGLDYLFNPEHVGLMLQGIGLSQAHSDEAFGLMEDHDVKRTLSIKEVNDGETTYYTAVITIYVKNESDEDEIVKVVEVIPKEFAENASDLEGESFKVIAADPVIEWSLALKAGQEKEIVYVLEKNLTAEEANELLESNALDKFKVPPFLLNADTSLVETDFSGAAAGLFGLGGLVGIAGWALAIIAVIVAAILAINYFGGREKASPSGLGAVSGSGAVGSSFFRRFGGFGKREEEPRRPKWAYKG